MQDTSSYSSTALAGLSRGKTISSAVSRLFPGALWLSQQHLFNYIVFLRPDIFLRKLTHMEVAQQTLRTWGNHSGGNYRQSALKATITPFARMFPDAHYDAEKSGKDTLQEALASTKRLPATSTQTVS